MTKASGKLSVAFLYDDSLDRNDGVAQYVKRLGKWLSEQGHSVKYLVGDTKMTSWEAGPVHSLAKNLKVQFNRNRVFTPLPAKSSVIKQVLSADALDVLHVMVPYSPLMAQRVINRISDQTAVVGTFHILPASKLSAIGTHLLRTVYGRSLARFDEMLAVSPAAAQFANRSLGVKAKVSPNVVEVANFRSSAKKPNYPHIVFLGRLVSRKGCSYLLEAFSLLLKDLPEARLTIAGDGPKRQQLEAYVAKRRLKKQVKFLGFIDEATKPDLLSSAHIACFPSVGGESFGIVLIEAMAAGADVVVGGDNPGYRSVLGPREETLIEPKNTELFTDRLKQLLSDKALANDIHAWQQNDVKKYDIETVGPRLIELYRQAIAKRPANRHNGG